METLVLENDDSFKVHLDRYKYADRHPGETQQTYRARGDDFLAQLETRLQRSSYLFGERASYADIAIFPFIRQFSKVEEKWFATRPYPALAKWLENFIEDDRFQLVMKKYKPWVPSDALVEFPPD
jgi:glutathione S-transferase